MGVDKPNYTQIPNLLLDDLMPYMDKAELKVTLAIARKTFGYHREKIKLSLTDLEHLTRMSRPSVTKGINEGIKRGTIEREEQPNGSFVYMLNINDEACITSKNSLLVKDIDQEGSKESLPEVVKDFDQYTPTLKKEKERRIKKEERKSVADATPLASDMVIESEKKQPTRDATEWQEFMGALCWVGFKHTDVGTLTEAQKGQLTSEAKKIWDAGYRKDDLRHWFVTVWKKDWRYQKDESHPKLSDVRSSIAALDAIVPVGFEEKPIVTNGNGKMGALDVYKEHMRKRGIAI